MDRGGGCGERCFERKMERLKGMGSQFGRMKRSGLGEFSES